MKDILDKLTLIESEKPKAALLNKKFSSFRDMEQLQGDASITTAHKPVKMGDQQKGLTGKLVGTTEAVENTVEDLVAKLGSEFKSQFMGDKKQPKKDQDLANAPADRDIGEKKPAKDIHVKEQGVAEAKADPTGSWVVHDGNKVKKFKTREGAKAYAEKNGGTVASSEYYHDKIAKKDVTEGEQRVDSLVTDALRVMKGSDVSDAVLALKRVLGDRAYNERRGFYSFYVKQIHDMYNQQGVAEGGFVDVSGWSRDDVRRLGHQDDDGGQQQARPKLVAWIFYNVKPGQEDTASMYKIRQLKSGKWAMPEYANSGRTHAFQRNEADKAFGPGRRWEPNNESVAEDAVADFLARGGQVQVGKPSRGPRRPGTSFGSKHIGTGRGGKASNQSGKSANTGPNAKPVVAAESVEMSTSGPMGSMPIDNVPQVQSVTEDWGSSDWTPVMKGMWDVIDRHYAGRANPESIEDAAQNAAEFYYDDMGYDEVEDAKDRIIGMFLRRPDGIGRKQDKTPSQELEEAGVIPAAAPAPGAAVAPGTAPVPADAGIQGQLNVKQLASVLPGIDAQTLAMAMTTLKAGSAPSMAQQKALAGAFAALVKADPQTTTKAMAILKKVSAEPAAAPVAAKPAPAPTAPVGTPAAAPVPAEESMDYIKENKRKR